MGKAKKYRIVQTINSSLVKPKKRANFSFGIQGKLIAGFLVVVLLVGGVVGYGFIEASYRTLKEGIGEKAVMLAQQTIDKIDRDIYHRIEESQVYAKYLILREAVKKSNEEFETLDDVQAYIHEIDQNWISAPKDEITQFMQEIFSNELSMELKEKINYYEERYDYSVFPEMYVTNKYGAIIASTGRTSDYLQADEDWYPCVIG